MNVLHFIRISLVAVPAALVTCLIRLAVGDVGILELRDAIAANSMSIFVSAFMLAGVINDYKEAEKVPGEVESAFQSLTCAVLTCVTAKGGRPEPALRQVHRMMMAFAGYLDGELSFDAATWELRDAEVAIGLYMDSHKASISGVGPNGHTIRSKFSRMHYIAGTSYIATGYFLMYSIVAFNICLLIMARGTTHVAGFFVLAVMTYTLCSLVALLADLDNPVDYPRRRLWTRMALSGAPYALDALETLRYGSSIDFSPIFGVFGQQLTRLMGPAPGAADGTSAPSGRQAAAEPPSACWQEDVALLTPGVGSSQHSLARVMPLP